MPADRARERRHLRVATHLAPTVLPLYRLAAAAMASRLGVSPILNVADSYARCAADIDDVCFVCSIPYLLFERLGGMEMAVLAAPVLIGERYRDRPVYYSDVIVRANSPLRRFDDLRGRRWAYNEPFSHSGHLVVLHELAVRGHSLDFFGDVVEAGFHDEAIRLVAGGEVDGAAIDSQVLAIALDHRPALREEIRVIGSLGPSTIQPVVASATRLDRDERAALREVLLTLHLDPVAAPHMRAAHVARFAAVPIAYRDVASMFDRVERAGLLDDAWWARWAAETAAPASVLARRAP